MNGPPGQLFLPCYECEFRFFNAIMDFLCTQNNKFSFFASSQNLLPLQHSQINGFQEIENLDIAAKFKGALMSKAHFPTFFKVIKRPFCRFFHFKCSFVWTKQPSDVLILRMAGTASHSLSEYLQQRRQQKSKLRLKSTSLQLSFQFIKFQRSPC